MRFIYGVDDDELAKVADKLIEVAFGFLHSLARFCLERNLLVCGNLYSIFDFFNLGWINLARWRLLGLDHLL